jgi:formylglycine-generating enzyme required for sulfatase activity
MSQKKRFYLSIGISILTVCFGIMLFATVGFSAENEKVIKGKDGAEMVLIPAGEFKMGSNDQLPSEEPVHNVNVSAFYMDKYEVTNAQYKLFMKETGHKEPEGWYLVNTDLHKGYISGELHRGLKPLSDERFNGDNQPVVCVNWEDAEAYAKWAGKRLPTAAEWEKAARGGLVGKEYVWGDDPIPPKGAGNLADMSARKAFLRMDFFVGYDDGYAYTAPVGSFKPNGYGLYDMAGNVNEWCSDWYDSSYYDNSPKKNPEGPVESIKATGTEKGRVVRGGAWCSFPSYARVGFRWDLPPNETYDSQGFRCVSDIK